MFANVEVISNNTYTFSNFTYEVPSSIKDKIKVGSVVQVTFRNKQLFGIVVKLNTETNIKKLNTITSIKTTFNDKQFAYLKYLATINRINIGMLIYNLFNIDTYKEQKTVSESTLINLTFNQIDKVVYKKNNVFFVSSLKQSKELYDLLKDSLSIDYYQKFGGKDELNKILSDKTFSNIIVLSNNFEKINIVNNTNYIFYDSNSISYKLPKLNELSIIESAYLKNYIFGGNFIFISEFPNFEFFNYQWQPTNDYNYEIEYFISNNTKDNIELLNYKYSDTTLNYYSSENLSNNKQLNYIDNLNSDKVDTIIIQNPSISKNKILNSYKLIYLLKMLNYAVKKNLKIIVFSSFELDINKSLNSTNMNTWINNEIDIRKKYGPSNLFKIYSVYSSRLIEGVDFDNFLGPKILNDSYIYELQIKLDDELNYEMMQKIFKIIKDCEIKRIRHIS